MSKTMKKIDRKSIKHTSPSNGCFTFLARAMALLPLLSVPIMSSVHANELSGNIAVDGIYFPQAGAYPNQQKSGGLSLSVQPEYKHSWDDGDKKITFSPFYRWDQQDKERTHVDIRQLDFVTSKGDWELQAGISSVYWGVTESQHLVDVINQKDAVEGLGGNAKLGQPLVRVSRFTENGSVDLFVLPYFRERTFAGEKGRFRSGLVVDSAATTFEDSKRKEKHVDYAVRWTNTFDEFDVGLHYFEGTSRDPELSPISTTALKAHYPLISQVGLDLQYTGESTIYKLESINRNFKDSSIKDYTAVVAGLEHTLPSFESGSELGLLAEYHNDSRGEVKSAPFQNDLFVGARYALNDENSSEVLAGAFVDLDNESKSLRVEASRRMGNGLKLNLEAQVFTDTDVNDPSIFFAKDDYVKVGIQKFF